MDKKSILLSARNSLLSKVLFVFTFALFGVTALGHEQASIDSQRWALVEINGKKVAQTKAFIEPNMTEKRFSGNAGCNQMFGNFEANGNNIKFSGIGTTKMFCSKPGVMKQEGDFIKLLEQSTRYKQQRNTLSLYAGKHLVLKFVGRSENTSSNHSNSMLEEKKWVLTAIEGKALPKLETVPFIVFDKKEEHVGGNSGCNVFSGKYKVEGEKIVFSNVISTMRACLEEPGNVEGRFWENLNSATHFKIEGNKLNFYGGEKVLLSFSGQEKK